MKKDRKIIIGIILAALGTIIISYGFQQNSIEISTLKGEISPYEIDNTKDFTVWIGSNQVVYSGSDLITGIDLNQFIQIEGFKYPLQIAFVNNKLFVSALIKNSENHTVAHMVNNQWAVSSDNLVAYDRNYNAYAVEVVDINKIPVLQVNVSGQNEVRIGFSSETQNSWVLVTPKGFYINPSEAEVEGLISAMFVYPSEKHLGELVNSNPIINWVSLESTRIIGLGVVVFVIGSLFAAVPTILNRTIKKVIKKGKTRRKE
jgi:hypothetical protein